MTRISLRRELQQAAEVLRRNVEGIAGGRLLDHQIGRRGVSNRIPNNCRWWLNNVTQTP